MLRLYQVSLLCYICLILILVQLGDSDDTVHHRPRRYLAFRNITRFFVRLNWKANIIPWTQIFAQALGFRMNFDEPPDSVHPYHHFQRRHVYDNLQILMDKTGLSGFQCIRRAICEMREIDQPTEIYHRILKMVFSQKGSSTDKWHNVTTEECYQSYNSCPLSVLDVSLYTDV